MPLPVAEVPPGVVTVMLTVPAIPAGDVAWICVSDRTVNVVALVVPNLTAEAAAKLVPVSVTTVPPAVVPVLTLNPLTVGAGAVTQL